MPSIQQVVHTSQNGTYQSYSVIEKWDCDGLQLFEIASFGICNSLLSRFASTEAKISKVESRSALIEVCNTKFCLHLCYLLLPNILCLQSFQAATHYELKLELVPWWRNLATWPAQKSRMRLHTEHSNLYLEIQISLFSGMFAKKIKICVQLVRPIIFDCQDTFIFQVS